MSLGYAEKLSYREDVGTVGMPEIFDTPELIQNKVNFYGLLLPYLLRFMDTNASICHGASEILVLTLCPL